MRILSRIADSEVPDYPHRVRLAVQRFGAHGGGEGRGIAWRPPAYSLFKLLQLYRRFVNRRCTDSIFLIRPIWCGDHTQNAYSIRGLTYVVNTNIKVVGSFDIKHCIKLDNLWARATILLICTSNFKWSSTVTPRSLTLFTFTKTFGRVSWLLQSHFVDFERNRCFGYISSFDFPGLRVIPAGVFSQL